MSLPWLSDPRRPLTSPRELPKLEAWFDALDTRTMLSGDGTTITDGGAVALWADKSGNSGVNCLVLPGVASNYGAAPDETALDIVGDIGLWCVAALNDITPATQAALVAKFNTVGDQRSYYLGIATTGVPVLVWSTTGAGAGNISVSCSENISAIATDYSKFGLGVTLDVDNGAGGYVVTFYKSTDGGATWSTFGTATTGGSTTSIHSGTAGLTIGAHSTGAGDQLNGRVYRAFVRNSTATSGAAVIDIDFSTAGKKLANGDTFVCATGQTVTLNSSGATGARIAGERDLYQGTLANRPVYLNYAGVKYGYLNGTAGNYFSTLDSAAVDASTELEVIVCAAMADWTPSAEQVLVSKYDTGANKRSYRVSINTSGQVLFNSSTDGAAGTTISINSTSSTGFSDGAIGWLKVTWRSSDGRVTMEKSSDGASYSSLTASGTGVTSALYNGDTALEIGATAAGTALPLNGRVYYASVSKTIGGAATAIFNPALYTSGTTFTASTGEVWTVQGGAHIVTRTGLYFDGSNDYLKTAAFSLPQPTTVYFTGEQTTWTDNEYIYSGSSGAASMLQQTSAPRIKIYAGGAGSAVAQNDTFTLKKTACVSGIFNSTASSLKVDRGAAATGSLSTENLNGFTLGSTTIGTFPANIFVSEVAIYSAAHATATQDRMALYAGRKHSFAV